MPSLTRVTFKVKADLEIGQNVRLTGDNRLLGSLSPNRGLDLVTTPSEYPVWRTNRPVNLPSGIPLSYKYVIVSGGLFHGWESIGASARVIIPEGEEMVVQDEIGVYDERGNPHARRKQELALAAQEDPRSLPPPTERKAVHPHVRFQLPDDGSSSGDVGGTDSISSADASAGRRKRNDNDKDTASNSTLVDDEEDDDVGVVDDDQNSNSIPAFDRHFHYNSGDMKMVADQLYGVFDKQPTAGAVDPEAVVAAAAAAAAVNRPSLRNVRYRMFLVSFNLPVLIYFRKDGKPGKRWTVEWNPESISRKSEGSVAYDHDVIWVGAVTPYVYRNIDMEDQWNLSAEDKQEIVEKLRVFDCVPIFMEREVFIDHYIRCCVSRYRDIFHNVLNVSLPREDKANRTRDRWDGFVEGSNQFARTILDLILERVTDRDLVWVHNFPLMLVPQILRELAREKGLVQQNEPKIVFFLHTPFPTSEIFRTLSVRNELLEGMLGADIVGFHTFDHARHFITSCKRFLGLQFHSQPGGRLVVEHKGRAVLVAISHVGIERHLLDTAVTSRKCQDLVDAIHDTYRGKIIIVGMDELTRLKGVPLKLLAFEKLLAECPKWRNKVVFIQHGLHGMHGKLLNMLDKNKSSSNDDSDDDGDNTSSSKDDDPFMVERATIEVKQLCERINRVYGPVVVFKEYAPHLWPDVTTRAAIWCSADILVATPIMEGLNLLPLEYTFCHRDPAGVVIISEFSAASRVLNGAIRINCYDILEISQALDQALCMSVEERNARRARDCSYIMNRSSAAWTRNILLDVETSLRKNYVDLLSLDKDMIQGSEYHSVVSFENVVTEGFCQPINTAQILKSFERCDKRLILLDYAGTLAPRELGNLAVKRDFLGVSKRKLSPVISETLKKLCADERNIVFVISGNSPNVLTAAFDEILSNPKTPLGISAHSGVMLRWGNVLKEQQEEEWEYILGGVADEWNRWMEAANIPAILEDYTWRTGGTSWRHTKCTTSWQFRQADPEWGGMQAMKMKNELEDAIQSVNVPVDVTMKKHSVELLPKGVDKGKAVTFIMQQLKEKLGFIPQFCFCVGDDTSDESMFSAVLDFMGSNNQQQQQSWFGQAFTCTVGRKPTAAQYFANDTDHVVQIVQSLAAQEQQQ